VESVGSVSQDHGFVCRAARGTLRPSLHRRHPLNPATRTAGRRASLMPTKSRNTGNSVSHVALKIITGRKPRLCNGPISFCTRPQFCCEKSIKLRREDNADRCHRSAPRSWCTVLHFHCTGGTSAGMKSWSATRCSTPAAERPGRSRVAFRQSLLSPPLSLGSGGAVAPIASH
jgi:hypothetical protein